MIRKPVLWALIVGSLLFVVWANANETHEYFKPPDKTDIPDNEFGDLVKYGQSLFRDTQQLGWPFVKNGLNCTNCHLDDGRQANSSPLWAAHGMYPAYRKKNGHVNTYEERLQGCFTYSMNGTPPESGSKELTALIAYSFWLSSGVPMGTEMPGRGYPEIAEAAQIPDAGRGKQVYLDKCAICHTESGGGMLQNDRYVFPPLWGQNSFNWGAGMHRINTAAAFIKSNMPYGQPNTLTDQEAWDVATYMNSHDRPQDPRFEDDVEETADKFHQHWCSYEMASDGQPAK